LSRTEQKFRTVLEAAPDAMVITSQDGVIELANSRADVLFACPRESLLGQNIRTLIPGWQDPAEVEMTPGRAMTTGVRLTAHRMDGSTFAADVTANPFTTPEGVLFTTAVRDATEQVLAEERIQRINLELERRVEERTAELTQSNEALRQFAWAASHDLQEPIRTVLAYSEWLAKETQGKLNSRQERLLDIVCKQARIVNSMGCGTLFGSENPASRKSVPWIPGALCKRR
jgi:PAS domain S-box-containing protein